MSFLSIFGSNPIKPDDADIFVSTLDDRQKEVHSRWRSYDASHWQAKILLELEQRIYNLEIKDKNL